MRDTTSARGAAQISDLHQIRLVDVLERNGFLPDRCGKRFQSNRASVVEFDDGFEHSAVGIVKDKSVNLELLKRIIGDLRVDGVLTLDLCKITYALEQAVGNTRRSARARGNFIGAVVGNREAKDTGTSLDDGG